mgnify:CR=1 FL=1
MLATLALSLAVLPAHADIDTDHLRFFDPASGFEPSQANLTDCYLQLASSLAHLGSPVHYIRHVQTENDRISTLYRIKFGRDPVNRLPSHMTPEYLDKLDKNWTVLAPKLGLEEFTKKIGKFLHNALRGTRDNGTELVRILNDHQAAVASQMTSSGPESVGFNDLKQMVISTFSLDKSEYSGGTTIAFRDATEYCHITKGAFQSKFEVLARNLSEQDAAQLTHFIQGVFEDAAQLAQVELQLAIRENSLR